MSDPTTEKAMLTLADQFPWADNLDKLQRAVQMSRGPQDEEAVKKNYALLKGKMLATNGRKERAPIDVDPTEKVGGNSTNSTAPTAAPEPKPAMAALEDMAKDELYELASEMKLDVTPQTAKNKMVSMIKEAQGAGGAQEDNDAD